MSDIRDFIFEEPALISRLSTALQRRPQQVICIVGSPLTAPLTAGGPGVPGVAEVIEMIRAEFADVAADRVAFEDTLNAAQGRAYQAAFRYLQGTRGQGVANEIVRKAVLCARVDAGAQIPLQLTDTDCKFLESDQANWHLNPGISALGQLISDQSAVFGNAVLTTNFDPLLEISIRRSSGKYYKTVVHAEGSLTQTEAEGCHVVHLHGYWFGSDTLHTNRQLMQDRPRLRTSLANLLKDKVVLVCGYGGWDDVLTSTLLDLVRDDASSMEVLWTLHGTMPPSSPVINQFLATGESRGRVAFYSGIDCNELFPKVLESWRVCPRANTDARWRSNPVTIPDNLVRELNQLTASPRILEGDAEDRPPVVEVCLGRNSELERLASSQARVIFVTGIGGQGKSTLAAKYFAHACELRRYELFVWRDCKEEGETFENQIASLVERLSGGVLAGSDLAKRPIESLVDILLARLQSINALLVFDNVDHFVNLENGRLTSAADYFVRKLLASPIDCQVVFTCRPEIWQQGDGILSLHLEGLPLLACKQLFSARGANSSEDEIADAHQLTDGHAFWLDLLALQVVRGQGGSLSDLVREIRAGQGPLPDLTLLSVWSKLAERERLVLHALGETVRPALEDEIAYFVGKDLNYNKLHRALNGLRRLNLIVVKRSEHGEDLHELHPLVRRFVRGRFTRNQRTSMIDIIISAYRRFRGNHRSELAMRQSISFLQNWTQAAELAIAAGRFSEACEWLSEARTAFAASAFMREYVRVVRQLLSSVDWVARYCELPDLLAIFNTHVRGLSHLGAHAEVDRLLDQFSLTVPEADSRFINYCEMRCHAAWIRENYQEAISWGERGVALEEKSNVDAETYVAHSLALARRDAGSPEIALPTFLEGRALSDVIDPNDFDEDLGGAYYGNVGRCLHLIGQARQALICYQKSALLIEKELAYEHVMNQGYIRCWIGELLLSRDQRKLGAIFLEAARRKWEQISPPKARRLQEMIRQARVGDDSFLSEPEGQNPEAICLDWIRGRELDHIFD